MKRLLFVIFVLSVLFSCSKSSESETKTIVIEGNPTTGYQWFYTGCDNNCVELVSSNYEAKKVEEGFVGAGGNFIFVFKGVKSGKDRLNFAYYRSWDKDNVAEIRSFSVNVGDSLKFVE